MAYCETCGADKGRRQTCLSCGKKPMATEDKEMEVSTDAITSDIAKTPESGIAIAALVIGIVSVLSFIGNGIGLMPAIVGLVLSITAKKETPNSAFAKAGFILNLVALICGAVIFLFTSTCLGCWVCTPFCAFPFAFIKDAVSYAMALM